MLLGIYLGTTAMSWYSVIRFKKVMENRLKNDGYKFVKKKYKLKDILQLIALIILASIPLVNLMFPFALTTKDVDYCNYRNKLLEEGSIVDSEEEFEYNRPIVNEEYTHYDKVIENNNPSVENDFVRMTYNPNMNNTQELVKVVEEAAKKRSNKVIEVSDAMLTARKNRYGHTYYSSVNMEDENIKESSGRTLKKEFNKR